MSNFHKDNIAVVTLRLKDFAEKESKHEVLRRMRRIAQKMVDFIDNRFHKDSQQFPEYTANLHDATGVAIYDNGRIDKYIPVARAKGPQRTGIDEEEWGYEELENVIKQGLTNYSKGLWLVMFSASSYAEDVEDLGSPRERGEKFFSYLWEMLSIDIHAEFEGCLIRPLIGLSDSIPF